MDSYGASGNVRTSFFILLRKPSTRLSVDPDDNVANAVN